MPGPKLRKPTPKRFSDPWSAPMRPMPSHVRGVPTGRIEPRNPKTRDLPLSDEFLARVRSLPDLLEELGINPEGALTGVGGAAKTAGVVIPFAVERSIPAQIRRIATSPRPNWSKSITDVMRPENLAMQERMYQEARALGIQMPPYNEAARRIPQLPPGAAVGPEYLRPRSIEEAIQLAAEEVARFGRPPRNR